MRNARSPHWFWFAALALWLGAGCAEGDYDGASVASGASPIDPPAADAPLRRFRSPRVDTEVDLRRDAEKRASLPGALPDDRPGTPRDALPAERSPVPDGAGQRRFEEHDDCFGRCGDDATCRLTCLDGLPTEEDCLECGRETGFLPRPELWLENVFAGKAVELRWTRVEHARRYVVYGIQWPYGPGSEPVSMSWATGGVSLRAELAPGFIYVFYVVAISADDVRSKPSRPVTVRL